MPTWRADYFDNPRDNAPSRSEIIEDGFDLYLRSPAVRHTVSSRRETLIIVDKLRHSANVFKPTSFFVGQRHNNSIANATDEFKRVLFIAGDFVDVMPERG
jgi:hypothetical protein